LTTIVVSYIVVIKHIAIVAATIACTLTTTSSATAASFVIASSVAAELASIVVAEMSGLMMKVVVGSGGFGIAIATKTCCLINPFSNNRPNAEQGFSFATPSFAYGYQNRACSCTP